MANVRGLVRASSGYGLSVISGGLISIAVIPVVIIVAGPHTWATIAVAQGVAGFGTVVAGAGWGITGPTETARLAETERGQYYLDSVVSRLWLFVPVTLICCVVTLVLVPTQPAIGLLALVAALVPALSAGFFFVGEKSPLRFLLIETLPRQAGSLVGAIMLFVTGDALWFVGLQLLGGVLATVLSSSSILRRYSRWRADLSAARSLARLREHVPLVSMSAVSTLYVNLPIVVVQIFLPQSTAVYALAERMMRLALYATRPYVQITQSYVPHPDQEEQRRRARRVTQLSVGIGVACGLAYAAAAPWVGLLLSGGRLQVGYPMAVSLSFALAAMLISQITGFTVLPTYQKIAVMAGSTIAGAVVGAAGLVPAALVAGVVGVTSVLALSEVVVLAVQLAVLPATLRSASAPTSR